MLISNVAVRVEKYRMYCFCFEVVGDGLWLVGRGNGRHGRTGFVICLDLFGGVQVRW